VNSNARATESAAETDCWRGRAAPSSGAGRAIMAPGEQAPSPALHEGTHARRTARSYNVRWGCGWTRCSAHWAAAVACGGRCGFPDACTGPRP